MVTGQDLTSSTVGVLAAMIGLLDSPVAVVPPQRNASYQLVKDASLPLTPALPRVLVRHGRRAGAYRQPRPQCSGSRWLSCGGCRPSYHCCQRSSLPASACSGWTEPWTMRRRVALFQPQFSKETATAPPGTWDASPETHATLAEFLLKRRSGQSEAPRNGLASGAKRRRLTERRPEAARCSRLCRSTRSPAQRSDW
jgi:hypothetical protein